MLLLKTEQSIEKLVDRKPHGTHLSFLRSFRKHNCCIYVSQTQAIEDLMMGKKHNVLFTAVKIVCASIHALDLKSDFLVNSRQIKSENSYRMCLLFLSLLGQRA